MTDFFENNQLQNFMWRVGHDPHSKDDLRCRNYIRTREILEHENECTAPQIFLRNLEQVKNFLTTLPGEYLNILGRYDHREKFICTAENMELLFELWFENTSMNPRRWQLGNLETLPRRFSLHLSQFIAIETFINSTAKFLLLIDDDFELERDFLVYATNSLDLLPEDWDVFNFWTNQASVSQFAPHIRVGKSQVSLTYQMHSGTCLVFSRNGAKKYLWDCVFGAREYEEGDSNIDKNIDFRIANVEILPPFNHPNIHYFIDWSPGRRFKSFQYTPEARSPVILHLAKSTMQD